MGMAAGPSKGFKSDINVTPLVDVVLVLLIIFMVITPMLQRGKDVQLPKTHFIEKRGEEDADPLILSVTRDKGMYLETDKYDEEGLARAIEAKLKETPGKRLLLKGDNALTFSDVRKVMNIVRKSGARGIGLQVEEVKK